VTDRTAQKPTITVGTC